MKRSVLVIFCGALAIILFDILASFASLKWKIDYDLFGVGSLLIYCGVGFFGAKYGNLLKALTGAGIVGFVEATLGWYISWIIGPGQWEEGISSLEIFVVIVMVTLTAAVCGLLGGAVGRLFNRETE